MSLRYSSQSHLGKCKGTGGNDLCVGTATESGTPPVPYDYGWPSGGTSESGVTAQWIFDEASGNIVDEVGGVTLVPAGTITYNVIVTDTWANLSPGCTIAAASRFNKNTDTPSLSPGTSAIVVEWVSALTNAVAATGDYAIIFSIDSDTGTRGFTIYQQYDNATTTLIDIHGTSGNRNLSWTIPDVRDGVIRKWRWVYNPTTEKSSLHINGVNYGEIDTSTIGSITAFHVGISNGSFAYRGTIYELRYTLGNVAANSGGPGGG